MSVRLTASSSEGLRIASASTKPWAVTGWYYLHSFPSAGQFGYLIELCDAGSAEGAALRVSSAGTLNVETFHNGGNTSSAGTLSLASWYYLGLTRPAGTGAANYQGWINSVATITRSDSETAEPGEVAIGFEYVNNLIHSNFADISTRGVRSFNSDLNAATMALEQASTTAVATAWADWNLPGSSVLTDQSGNGRSLVTYTSASTGTNEPPPFTSSPSAPSGNAWLRSMYIRTPMASK